MARDRGDLPGSIFSLEERANYRTLRTDKRRRDWLAGRVAAKRAVTRYLSSRGCAPDHNEIEICNCLDGRPFARCGRLLNISLSHCAAGGLATVSGNETIVGADWETIKPMPLCVIHAAFDETEISKELLDSPALQTRLWTLKEAVIKLLSWAGEVGGKSIGLGHLKEIHLTGPGPLPRLTGVAAGLWNDLGSPVIRLESQEWEDTLIAVAWAACKRGGSFR